MHFGFALDSSDIDSLDIRATDIHSKHFVCLQEVLKTSSNYVFESSSRHVFKTSWRPLQCNTFLSSNTSSRCLERQKFITLKTCWKHLQDMSWRPTNVCWVTKSVPASTTRTSCITGVSIINKFLNMFFCSVYVH